jgi:hypothetical protein
MSSETTRSFINKVFLAKKLKHVGFTRKSIFNNLLKEGRFDKFLSQHEENLNNVISHVEIDLREFIKKHKKTIAKEEILLKEEKLRKEIEKAKKDLEDSDSDSEDEFSVKESTGFKQKIIDEDEVLSDQEPERVTKISEEDFYFMKNDNESMKEEIECLKEQLLEKDNEISKLKKRNFTLNKKLKTAVTK